MEVPSAGPPGAAPPGDRLESWKEIASYLGRTPRTVQRWERQEGLPVHRLVHDKLGSVYAFRSELDAWWKERKAGLDEESSGGPPEAATAEAEPAPPEEAPVPPRPHRSRGPLFIVAGAILVVLLAWLGVRFSSGPLDGPVKLAVLPFLNLGGGPEQEYLSDGLTEEMITELGRVHPERLGVIARTSVMRYKGATPGIDRIGAELGVAYVLEGSVRQAADRVRVAVKLIRVKDQTPLWADSFEPLRRDILEMEREVARRVATEIRLKLSDRKGPSPRTDLPVDSEAHEAYLKGRYFWNKRSDEGFRRSVEFFEEAVGKDPSYAAAYSGLADAYTLMANYSVLPVAEAFPKAKAAAQRALALEPDLAEAHASLAFILRNHDWDFAGADQEFRKALELNPNYALAHFWYGLHLQSLGRVDEARAALLRARELDPLSPGVGGALSQLPFVARRFEEAIALERKTLELDPDRFGPLLDLGRALAQLGRYDEAIVQLEKAIKVSDEHPMGVAVLGYVYGKAGRIAEARQTLARLEALSSRRHVAPYYWAVLYCGLGDKDQAFRWLDKVYEERHIGVLTLKVEPEFDGLRGDPRYAALLRRVGLPE